MDDKPVTSLKDVGIDHKVEQPPVFNTDIFGKMKVVSTVPVNDPRNAYEQMAIYSSGSTVGLYVYDPTNGWQLVADTQRIFEIKVLDDLTTLSTGDGKMIFCIPEAFDGLNLISAEAFVSTVSSSGTPTIQIRNVTQTADMLSTRITIDASDFTSYDATTPSVVDTANDDVATGDLIAVDIDVAGTGAKGLGVILVFA